MVVVWRIDLLLQGPYLNAKDPQRKKGTPAGLSVLSAVKSHWLLSAVW